MMSIRRPLREFLESSFPDESGPTLQNRIIDEVVEQIITTNDPYVQILVSSQAETASRRVNIPATIETLLRTFLEDFLKALFCNGKNNILIF